MKKTVKTLAALALTLSMAALAGCNNNNPVPPTSTGADDGTNTASTDAASNTANSNTVNSDPADEDYALVEVESPAGFTGNVGDVTLEKGDTYAVIKIKDYGEIKCKLFPEAAPKGVQNFIDTANSGFYTDKICHRVMKDFMMQGGSKNGDGMSSPDEASFGVEYNKDMRHFYGALCYANAGGVNGTQFYIVNSKNTDLSNLPTASQYEEAIKSYNEQIEQLKELAANATGDEQTYYNSYLEAYQAQVASYENSKRATEQLTAEMEDKYNEVGGTPFLDGSYTVFGQVVEGFDVVDKISEVEVEAQSGSDEISHPVTDVVIESVTIGTVE